MLQDLRHALRTSLRNPAFVAMAVLTLGLGLGIATAVFAIVDAVLLRPLPFAQPERIVQLWEHFAKEPQTRFPSSEVGLAYFQEHDAAFGQLAGYALTYAALTGGARPEQVRIGRCSPSLFPLLRVVAARGRTFAADEERPGRGQVALLSWNGWRQRFGADPAVVGRTLGLDGERRLVVGVLPADFHFPLALPGSGAEAEIWLPLTLDRAHLAPAPWGENGRYLDVVGRLRPGISMARAVTETNAATTAFREQYAKYFPPDSGWGVELRPLLTAATDEVRPALRILLGAAALVLFISCANAGNLLLIRAQRRRHELALRLAVGMTPSRLLRLLLVEGLLLAALGALLGTPLALWGTQLLTHAAPPGIPRIGDLAWDPAMAAFAVVAALAAGALAALLPALTLWRADLSRDLKEGSGRVTRGFRGRGLRQLLLIGEVTLAVVVLIATSLLAKDFRRLTAIDPGFATANVLTLRVPLAEHRYVGDPSVVRFFQRLLVDLRAIPGVQQAAVSSNLPLGPGSSHGISIEGRTPPGETPQEVDFQSVSADYFTALGMPLLAGRPLSDVDKEGSPGAVVIDSRLAQRLGGYRDAIGKRLKQGRTTSAAPWFTVVGVVGHVRRLGTAIDTERDQVYYSYRQVTAQEMSVVLHARSLAVTQLAAAVRARVLAIDPEQPVAQVETMRARLERSLARARFATILLATAAIAALLLVCGGSYGVFAAATGERTAEIGVRMAFGAPRAQVVRLLLLDSARLGLLGIAGGLAISLAVIRVLDSQLHGISAFDPVLFVAVSLLLVGVLLAASLVPALRAVRLDPVKVLRSDHA